MTPPAAFSRTTTRTRAFAAALRRVLITARLDETLSMRTCDLGMVSRITRKTSGSLTRACRRARQSARGPPSRGEEQRRGRLVADSARLGSPGYASRFQSKALEARLARLPERVSIEPDRLEVQFTGAKEAVVRLFAMAQALTRRADANRARLRVSPPVAADFERACSAMLRWRSKTIRDAGQLQFRLRRSGALQWESEDWKCNGSERA